MLFLESIRKALNDDKKLNNSFVFHLTIYQSRAKVKFTSEFSLDFTGEIIEKIFD